MTDLADVADINPRIEREQIDLTEMASFVGMANVSEESGSITTEEARPLVDLLKGFTPFIDGDVLVAKITPCFENGKIVHARISRRQGFGSTEFHVLRPRAEKLDDRYLFHFLRQPYIRVEGERRMTGSAGQRRVPRLFLEKLHIPLPPLPEQRRIAAILDKVDALRAKRREAIAKLDQLLQSVFFDIFGDLVTNSRNWPTRDFSDAVDFLTGHPFKSVNFIPAGHGIKLCRGINVLPSRLDWSDEVNWSRLNTEQLQRFKIESGDIVVAMDRPWISSGFKIVMFGKDSPSCLLVQRVARLRPKAYFTSSFLFALFSSAAFKRHCKPTETTIPHISPNDFRSFPIPDPGKEALGRYESVVTSVNAQVRKLELGVIATDHLFKTAQHLAFSNRL